MAWKKNSVIKYDYGHLGEVKIPKTKLDSDKWGTTKKSLKKYIKFHLSVIQDNTCAYCREEIVFNGYGEPIEHIVPKSLKPNWMYHPQNLCLSCYGCNTIKIDKDTLKGTYLIYGKKYEDLPELSNKYIIVHPYFDKHSEFIDSSGILFKGKIGSRKGESTIKICSLNRLDLLYKRAKRKSSSKDLADIVMKVIRNPNSSKKDIEVAQSFIDELIKRQQYLSKLRSKT